MILIILFTKNCDDHDDGVHENYDRICTIVHQTYYPVHESFDCIHENDNYVHESYESFDECVHDQADDNVDVEPGGISPTQLPIEAHPGADR